MDSSKKYLITSFVKRRNKRCILCCESLSLTKKEQSIEAFLLNLSQKVFLYSSDSQLFLFAGRDRMKNLFIHPDKLPENHLSQAREELSKINNFHTYSYIPVADLIESFQTARDLDFKEADEGLDRKYGNRYITLLQELDSLLPGKRIAPDFEFSKITFKGGKDYQTILNPEDLSHGELRKLGLYLWMKNKNIQDSIVLIDELEIGLHPDWQYQIANDLIQDFPDNQYIVATHSYDMCETVTPAHVKEISSEFSLNHKE